MSDSSLSAHQRIVLAGEGARPTRGSPAVANAGVSMSPKFQTTEPGVRLKGSFVMRWRILMRGRVEERAVAVAPDGSGAAGCVRGGRPEGVPSHESVFIRALESLLARGE